MRASSRLLTAIFLTGLIGAGLPAAALAKAGSVRKGAVAVELVSRDASIQPGRPFWVALKLNHDEHWHSYWLNPGTGYPTSLAWKLPEGFTAGDIVWPTPHVVKDTKGQITGYGYEGETLLFVEITPPATLPPGTEVTLQATAEWLMCMDVCMPGDAKLELALPVRPEPPQPDMTIARKFNTLFNELPKPDPAWAATASRG